MRPVIGDSSADSGPGTLKVGVVTARFNFEVTEKLEQGALSLLLERGVKESDIVLVRVPGAFEIPLAIQNLFQQKEVMGAVALGAVIRGETTHYDYVCNAVERGCSELALRFNKPVGFGVLTTENEQQALARAGGAHGNKGAEAAQVALEMANLISKLKRT